jgi:phosphotransferase system enzyme I (PtsI)
VAPAAGASRRRAARPARAQVMVQKLGIHASPGVAIGPALLLDTEEYRIPLRTVDASQIPAQVHNLDAALESSRQEVADLRAATARKHGKEMAGIFAFHEGLIADPRLRARVAAMIQEHGYTAAFAFAQEMNRRQKEFRTVADPYMKERVRDLFDIEKRVLRNILGRAREDITRLTQPVVIVANDITPSQAVSFDPSLTLGFALNVGGQTSHMAIIARSLGVPAVVALNDITADVAGGETIIVDGTHGVVVCDPDAETIARYRAQEAGYRKFTQELRGLRDQPAVTKDGTRITLLANIELAAEARTAFEHGAEGIGLYRSEFLFLSSERVPTEEQQYEVFRAATRHARGRPIVIRTVDLGADKMAAHMGDAHEHNPVLGFRSVRYCLHHLDMFRTHLRAIVRVAAEGDVRIMFPMITTLMELRQAKAALADVMEDLEEEGVRFRRDIPIGIMIETPSAAILSGSFAREVSFFSIGTNDLTQYTLAVDRGNERVSYLYSPHSPAVLKLLRDIILAGRKARIETHLCGEMAGSLEYCLLLIGLGLRHLSMAAKNIPEIKKIVRSTTIRRCEAVARKALRFDDDRQVLNYLRDQTRSIIPEAM